MVRLVHLPNYWQTSSRSFNTIISYLLLESFLKHVGDRWSTPAPSTPVTPIWQSGGGRDDGFGGGGGGGFGGGSAFGGGSGGYGGGGGFGGGALA